MRERGGKRERGGEREGKVIINCMTLCGVFDEYVFFVHF